MMIVALLVEFVLIENHSEAFQAEGLSEFLTAAKAEDGIAHPLSRSPLLT